MPRSLRSRSVRRSVGGFTLVCLLGVALGSSWGAAQPSPRFYVNAAYVPLVGKVLVYGGIIDPEVPAPGPVEVTDPIWWWDPVDGSWTRGLGDGAPASYVSQIAVHDPTGKILVYGARGFSWYGETWLFDPTNESWEQFEVPMELAPTTGLGPGMTYHPPTDTFVMYGNKTGEYFDPAVWHLDLAERTWTKVETQDFPMGRNYVSFVYDPTSELIVLYGSTDWPINIDFRAYTYDPASLTWQVGGAAPTSSIGDYYSKTVFDHDSGKLVRYGGTGEHSATPWIYDVASATWQELVTTGPSPESRRSHAMTAVPGLGVVVFGGVGYRPSFAASVCRYLSRHAEVTGASVACTREVDSCQFQDKPVYARSHDAPVSCSWLPCRQ